MVITYPSGELGSLAEPVSVEAVVLTGTETDAFRSPLVSLATAIM